MPCSVCSPAYFSLLEAFIVCQKEGKVWIKKRTAHLEGSSGAGLGQGCPGTLTGMLYSPIGWKLENFWSLFQHQAVLGESTHGDSSGASSLVILQLKVLGRELHASHMTLSGLPFSFRILECS